MRWGWMALAAFACAGGLAFAQTPPPDPVESAYSASQAALARNDLAAAETAAAAALAASEARDGEGGRTTVLAFNLAQVHIRRAEWIAARASAARALALAQAHPDAGVDVHAAEMLAGETRFTSDWPHASAQVLAALAAVASRHDIDEVAYEAARRLADFANAQRAFDIEEQAWASAIVHARGVESEALAKISLAATLLLEDRAAFRFAGGDYHGRADRLTRAGGLLLEAKAELWPLAQVQGPDDALTVAQDYFARADGWQSAPGFARLTVEPRNQAERDAEEQIEKPAQGTLCHYRVNFAQGDLRSYFPSSAIYDGVQGAAVVRVIFNADGAVARTQIAAAARNSRFEHSATAVAARTTLTRIDEGSVPGCVFPHARFVSINFARHP